DVALRHPFPTRRSSDLTREANHEQINNQDSALLLTDEFEHAFQILNSGANLFLTGKAGTGKSTLIRAFMAAHEHRRVLVAAPTRSEAHTTELQSRFDLV